MLKETTVNAYNIPNMNPFLSYWYDEEKSAGSKEAVIKRNEEKFRHYKSNTRRVIKDFYSYDKKIYKEMLNKLEECTNSEQITILLEYGRKTYML